ASSSTAFKTFSLINNILDLSPQDEIYRFDPEENRKILRDQPWIRECVYTALWSLAQWT
ncbi:uncharacterized protein LAESUDRAFT_668073, partial [Laetiporus sulphureus 93-53]